MKMSLLNHLGQSRPVKTSCIREQDTFLVIPKKPLIALVPEINLQKSSQRYFKCDAPVLFVAVIAE
jgi:hypothetical protein